jgi:hypothetical protein
LEQLIPFDQAVQSLKDKGQCKLLVVSNAKNSFALFKTEAKQLSIDLSTSLSASCEVEVLFRDSGEYQFDIQFGEDVLIFNLHDDVFDFDRSHALWKTSYLKENRNNAFCCMISMFSFLRSSLETNRFDDLGYMIGRILVNHENHFFVEGNKQLGFLYNDLASSGFTTIKMREVLLTSLNYCLQFDLLLPEYEQFTTINVAQINEISRTMRTHASKPLGFLLQKGKTPEK